jgi:hypothetical protein
MNFITYAKGHEAWNYYVRQSQMANETHYADKEMIACFLSVMTQDWSAKSNQDGLFEVRCLAQVKQLPLSALLCILLMRLWVWPCGSWVLPFQSINSKQNYARNCSK